MTEEKFVTSPMEKMRLRMAAEGYNTLPLDFDNPNPGRIIVTIILFSVVRISEMIHINFIDLQTGV